ncbi:PDDEXK nuclease domain-containing protein [Pirellulaceae bacterium SH449]
MKKKAALPKKATRSKRIAVAKTEPSFSDISPLIAEVRDLIQFARRGVASVVDTFQVLTNFEIGRRIVVHEQKGNKRAAYGTALLKELSARLTEEFGAGFSERNLRGFRLFYQTYQDRLPEIWQTVSAKSQKITIWQTVSAKLPPTKKQQTAPDGLASIEIAQPASGQFNNPFTLSWSHYVELLGIKDPDERSFYEIESANSGWNVRELKRQKASGLYQRLALSRDKAGIRKLATEGQIIARPQDLLKNPLVLEFLGLDDRTGYTESDLESAIINHLERFLLELGKGFLFEARQKRFTFDGDHYFLDLVFYNRLLRCYVIIDLKLDKLTHQDLGQMQMYVNYYDRHVKLPEENATIGLLLCREKNAAVVELTLPKDANIHANEYQLYLPAKELLKAKLLEWLSEEEARV